MPIFASESETLSEPELKSTRSGWINTYYDDSLYLKVPSTTLNTPAFCTVNSAEFVGTGSEYVDYTIYSWAVYQNTTVTATFNVGYSNASTGKTLGLTTLIPSGGSAEVDPPHNVRVAVRASTYDKVEVGICMLLEVAPRSNVWSWNVILKKKSTALAVFFFFKRFTRWRYV